MARIIIASHDLEFILELCSRVIIMDAGRIVADGKADEMMSDDELMKSHHMEKPHSLFKHTHKENIGRGTSRNH